MMAAGSRYGPPTTLFNAAFFNGLMAAAASLAAAYFVHRAYRTMLASGGEEAVAEPLLIGWATLWLLVTAGQQIARFAPEGFALAIWLSVVSAIVLVYAALSRLFDWTHVSMPATAHAPLMAVGVAISASTLSGPLESGGALAWPFALAVHAVVLRVAAPRWSSARSPVHAFGLLVIAALGALQGRAITTDWGDASSAWPWLGWLVVPAVLLLWLPSPSAARLWPVSAAPRAYQSAAAGVLAAGLLLWTVVANVASDGSASPLPHVPLVNPLDLGIATALFAIWRWSRSEPVRDGIAERGFFPMVLFLGAAFVWLNAMLVRGFHHYQDVPYRAAAWEASRSVQTGFTLLWSITALVLMWLSARRAVRTPWIAGAVLLGAVVLKLLLIDMSGSGTVARIVSFIGVGVLMLVIGYVAPLPSGAVVESKGTHVES